MTEKHKRLSLRFRQKQGLIPRDYDASRDPNILSESDWQHLVSQRAKLSKSQRDQVRYTLIHEGISENLRGPLWVKLLEIEQAVAIHSD